MYNYKWMLLIIIFFLFFTNKIREGNQNMRRTIVTMTTIPERIEKNTIEKTLNSIAKQTIIPDVMYINISKLSKNNIPYPIDKLQTIVNKYPNLKIKINIGDKDLGPITKIIPTLPFITELDNVILIDDDVEYIPEMIEQLINTNEQAVGYAGRTNDLIHKNSDFYYGPVAFLETYAGVLYYGKVLIGLDDFNNSLNKTCENQDDIIIGKFLHSNNIIPIIGQNLKKPGAHDAQGTTELMTTNLSAGGNKICFEYIFSKN